MSLLLALHLLAVFVGPWAFAPLRSQLANSFYSVFRPYVQATFLGNGYRFFAPEPGPSHLVRYELELPDGEVITGRFPDLNVHRPRLFYHRHFMLSEFINSLDAPASQEQMQRFAKSYAKHLARRHGAQRVKLTLVKHYIPRMEEVQQGMRLDDPRLFDEEPLGEFSGDEL